MTRNHISMLFQSSWTLIAVLAAPMLIGCQQPQGPELATVTGAVTLDGEPLEGATVQFQPKSGRPSYGSTDKSGKYSMNYTLERSGVSLGDTVVIIRTQIEDEHGKVLRKELLPKKYHDQSVLTAVVEDKANKIDFDLQSK